MKTVEEIKEAIKNEIPSLDTKPYSEAIISINLVMAYKYYGQEEKDKIIDGFGLEKLGWKKNQTNSPKNITRSSLRVS
jgi:hypothetical protein